jgi:DNA-binding GntR family transcriptional regulator
MQRQGKRRVPTSAQLVSREGAPTLDARPTPIGDRIHDALLSQMISLKIPPGSRLSIDALAREFGVSQTPIRAALIRLESVGLVEKTHNVGYSAMPLPSRHRVDEMFDMRLLLEPYLAGRAAERMTKELRGELKKLVAVMNKPRKDDPKTAYGHFALQNADFHSWIAEHGGNAFAAEALSRLYTHTHLFRLHFHSQVTTDSVEEHALIVEALSAGDAAAAREAMAAHITKSRDRIAPYLENWLR